MTDRGFTLLEVLVAFTLVALVIGASFAAMSSGSRAAVRADTVLESVAIAENALARIGHDLALEPGKRTETSDGRQVKVTIATAEQNPAFWSRLGQMLYRVEVRVQDPVGGPPLVVETMRIGALP